MGSYIREIKEATTYIHKDCFPELLDKIKEAARNNKWKHYHWRDDVINAKRIGDVAYRFGIRLITDDNYETFRVELDGTYYSPFLYELEKIVAPYMSDGEITIRVENDYIVLQYQNHVLHKEYYEVSSTVGLT